MSRLTKLMSVALTLCWLSVGTAHSALVTLSGTNFDLQYDDTLLGLFGAPTLVGNTFFFTPTNFRAESLNGQGSVSTNSTVSGITLIAKNNYQFTSFALSEFGDYLLDGVGSSVSVHGQLRAFNLANPVFTQTSNNLVVNPLTPLALNDGVNHDWQASALIDGTTGVTSGQQNVIQSGASNVGLTIENRLRAFTQPGGTGVQQAFIEKKFAGTGVTVTVNPVPLPPSFALLASGLLVAVWLSRRRSPRA